MAPTPAKGCKVDPINFKELVLSLACAPQFMPPQPHHNLDLQSTADYSIAGDIVPSLPMKTLSSRDIVEVSSPLVPVSTTSNNWCFLPPIMNPRV